MTEATIDAPLLERTDPARSRPLPSMILDARQTVRSVAEEILAIAETSLERPWATHISAA